MSNVIEQLRREIDTKHAEAINALAVLQEYLEATPSPRTNGRQGSPPAGTPKRTMAPRGSIRERVVSAFRNRPRTVRTVADELGLTPKQVRGVVGARDLGKHFTHEEVDGVMRYQFREPREQ